MYDDIPHRISLPDESIEDILGKVLALDDDLFVLGVLLRIEGGECVDAVGFLGDAGSDRPGIETEETGSPDDRDLGSSWDQYLDAIDFEFLDDFLLQEGTLGEASHHEDEVQFLLLGFH